MDKINEFKTTLEDSTDRSRTDVSPCGSLSIASRIFTMPLHVGDNHDQGGNRTQVRFFDRGTNMHRLWDADMIERAGETKILAGGLGRSGHARGPHRGDERDRRGLGDRESTGRQASLPVPETGKRLKPGQKLGGCLLESNLPVVRRRLYQAVCGWRWCSTRHFRKTDYPGTPARCCFGQ